VVVMVMVMVMVVVVVMVLVTLLSHCRYLLSCSRLLLVGSHIDLKKCDSVRE
jgi:hypothetical protein